MKKFLLIVFLSLLLTGCADYHELQDLGIVSSIYIDYDGKYYVDVEIGEDKSSKHYKGSGITLESALENTLESTKKYLYYTHMNAIILTPRVNINGVLKYLARNPDINNTFYVVISENDDVLKLDETGKTLKSILKRYDYDTFFEITKCIMNPRQDYVLPNFKDGYIDSLALVRNNKIVSYLNNEQIETYRLLKKKNEAYFIGTYKNKKYEVNSNDVKVKYEIKDKIFVNIDVSLSISLFELDLDLTKSEDVLKFQNIVEKRMEKEVTNFLTLLKEEKTDILNLNNALANKKKKTDELFYKYDFNVKIKVNINKKGLILK